ncbi:MAG: hypothetical protein ACYC3Q_15285 [Gemmatimonadaceae bacterium]
MVTIDQPKPVSGGAEVRVEVLERVDNDPLRVGVHFAERDLLVVRHGNQWVVSRVLRARVSQASTPGAIGSSAPACADGGVRALLAVISNAAPFAAVSADSRAGPLKASLRFVAAYPFGDKTYV